MLTPAQPVRPRQPIASATSSGPVLISGVDISPMSIIRMIWKRKLSILFIWVVVTAVTVAVVQTMPAIYVTSALLMLDSQKIPERYVSATVNADVQERFATISQQILSSSQLKKLIDQFNLYAEQRDTHFPEEVFEMMRSDIQITPEKTVNGTRTGAFRISYQGPDPAVIAQVVNQIANLYIEENLKTREEQAGGTSEFIDAQLHAAKQTLDELEATVSEYKVRHNGELPQQENSLIGALGRLQIELEANRDAINRAQASKITLENSLGIAEDGLRVQMQTLKRGNAPSSTTAEPVEANDEPQVRASDRLRSEIRNLRARYSDEHPDMIQLRGRLERVEAAEKADIANSSPRAPRPRTTVAAPPSTNDAPEIRAARERINSTQAQLTLIRQEIETRRNEQKRILGDIAGYQSRVGRLPIREQEMSQITRDYGIAKLHYQSLLDKKISADMAGDMERRQKAERFTIADAARVPGRPAKPNRPMYRAAGCIAGLVLGLVFGLGREMRLRKLLGDWQVPPGIPVIARVPAIKHSSLGTEVLVKSRWWPRRSQAVS